MLYVLHAYDYTDEGAYDRRLAVRQAHLDGVRGLKANGHFMLGGALLDPDGKMIGSMMVIDFNSMEQLNEWLPNDPYVVGRVWDRIDIKPFRQAEV